MSIIMAVGNKHKLILASDGRVSDINEKGEHIILDENFKKICRLSDSVCVLIAGNRNQCMQIVYMLKQKINACITPHVCAETIDSILQNHALVTDDELNVRMIVAGINSAKEREMYLFSADQDGIEREKKSLTDNVIYVAKGDIKEGETDYFNPILNIKGIGLKTRIKLCIAEAAKRNRSVNDVVFFEEL